MKTGEGKTLVSTLPAYLNGLGGKGVHLVTVNDYLARRDAEWMGQIHRFLGLEVGLIIPGFKTSPAEKRQQYAADITYGTNNEMGFDYLRDNMAGQARRQDPARPQLRHRRRGRLDPHRRGPHAADHLRSRRRRRQALLPLRLDRPLAQARRRLRGRGGQARRRAARGGHRARSRPRSASRTSTTRCSRTSSTSCTVALKAKELYKRDKDYIVQGGEVKIVDEFTGRILEGRRWSEGIHQAVEAKEGVKIKEENQTLATITLQNYFRMYDKLAGMTGTAATEAAELMNTYELGVVPIPTNLPVGRARPGRPDLQGRGGQVRRRRRRHRRALRDAASRSSSAPSASRRASTCRASCAQRGIAHEVLNAKQHTREAHDRRPGRPPAGASPWPPTWPAAASTSCSAATPRGWPATRCSRRATTADVMVDDVRAARAARPDARGLPGGAGEGDGPLRRAARRVHASSAQAEGDQVRELGGLYVIGSERHESAAASTTSCAAAPAARATPARAASTSASTTS